MATLTILTTFDGTNGQQPDGRLIADSAGDLLGTTSEGGANGDGTVFEITKIGSSYASTPTTLASFNGADGDAPFAGLTADAAGNLFGTTANGGLGFGTSAFPAGTVFEVAKNSGGYASTPAALVTFNADGRFPEGSLITDATGDLFGTTYEGGLIDPSTGNGSGTVFEIPYIKGSYASTPTTLVHFNGTDGATGANPLGGLIVDAAGDLFGTTQNEGANGNGTVFEIPYSDDSYASTPTTLVNFDGTNGSAPEAGLIADSAGDLFGTTEGGGTDAAGTVFEIPCVDGTYASTPTTLASFNAGNPQSDLIADAAGDLFGVTTMGGAGFGTVFEIAKAGSSYASTPKTLASFPGVTGGNGSHPYSGQSDPSGSLFADATGNLFGTAYFGGPSDDGTVFELTGTGFQVACYIQGTRITTATGEQAIELLAVGDLVRTESGKEQAIIWIGHRHVVCSHHPHPHHVWPVRIRKGAFATNIPHCDLLLSPNHAVFIDGRLIPIRYLINGSTIVQEQVDEVTYCHIELEKHDVIFAEGLACESYLDTGNRSSFANDEGRKVLPIPPSPLGSSRAQPF
jgi:uncharacterized repeat protein (TIGR03803 family)